MLMRYLNGHFKTNPFVTHSPVQDGLGWQWSVPDGAITRSLAHAFSPLPTPNISIALCVLSNNFNQRKISKTFLNTSNYHYLTVITKVWGSMAIHPSPNPALLWLLEMVSSSGSFFRCAHQTIHAQQSQLVINSFPFMSTDFVCLSLYSFRLLFP